MRKNLPLVSIGIPVYNGQRYLHKAIDSILTQTYSNIELIISDNGSTDSTSQICREYQAKDERIRYHRFETNQGAAKNFNTTFELAEGKFFKWHPSDDICDPELVEKCISDFEKVGDEVVIVFPKTTLIDENDDPIEEYDDRMDLRLSSPEQRFEHVFKNLLMCNVVLGLIRSEALAMTRLIAPYTDSDITLICELALMGQFRQIPENLFFRRFHTQMSRQANRTNLDVEIWFDPGNRRKNPMPKTKSFVGFVTAVNRSEIPFSAKLKCHAVIMNQWFLKYWRHIGGEWKLLLKSKISKPSGRMFPNLENKHESKTD